MTDDLYARAAAQPFFSGVASAHLRTLCQDAVAVSYQPGERIFAEGDAADRFWLTEAGSVALDLRVTGRGDQVIETLLPGTVLGWSWLDPPYRWQFGAVARGLVEAIAFDAASVRRRCDADPAFGYTMLRLFLPVITHRLHATRLRVLDLYATPAQVGRP
jgi:CRP/FNR family transcriptional regulator, cyclic AMP receptor protein